MDDKIKTLFRIVKNICSLIYEFSSFSNLIKQILFELYTRISATEFAVLVCLCMYLLDDDVTNVETCRRNISDK